MDPEDWSVLMSRALGEIDQAVRRYDGSIAKLLGDGVLALFGAETAHEDDPERAVRAAAEILEAFERLRASDLPAAARDLQIRVGINTGLALVGSVSAGDGDRADMSAYGDTVNVAARLQSAATPGRALLAASTYRLVAHAVEARDLGPILLKGRAEPVHVHELVGLRRRRTRHEASRACAARWSAVANSSRCSSAGSTSWPRVAVVPRSWSASPASARAASSPSSARGPRASARRPGSKAARARTA